MYILVSACLIGLSCRYDSQSKQYAGIDEVCKGYSVLPVCPEQLGGFATPRLPAERRGKQVVTAAGDDVTVGYVKGAREVLKLALQFGCTTALLKEKSPSCGCGKIYDGTFTHRVINGDGVTTDLLKEHGIVVWGETQWQELLKQIKN